MIQDLGKVPTLWTGSWDVHVPGSWYRTHLAAGGGRWGWGGKGSWTKILVLYLPCRWAAGGGGVRVRRDHELGFWYHTHLAGAQLVGGGVGGGEGNGSWTRILVPYSPCRWAAEGGVWGKGSWTRILIPYLPCRWAAGGWGGGEGRDHELRSWYCTHLMDRTV